MGYYSPNGQHIISESFFSWDRSSQGVRPCRCLGGALGGGGAWEGQGIKVCALGGERGGQRVVAALRWNFRCCCCTFFRHLQMLTSSQKKPPPHIKTCQFRELGCLSIVYGNKPKPLSQGEKKWLFSVGSIQSQTFDFFKCGSCSCHKSTVLRFRA